MDPFERDISEEDINQENILNAIINDDEDVIHEEAWNINVFSYFNI